MIRSKIYWLYVITGLFLIAACKAFIEPSISNSIVNLEAPGNNYQSLTYAITFNWDNVDDALTYHLQVVTPNLANIGAIVLDTIIKTNTFTRSLAPGTYQWQVLAANGSSKTAYSAPRSFTIVSSSLKSQSVILSSPANNTITNQSPVLLQWGNIYGATKYQIEIDTNNFVNEAAVLLNQVIPGTQLSYTFPKDQTYQWRVKAENDTAQAQWSAVNTIVYNHTPPGMVALTAPTNNQTLPSPVSLQWGTVSKAVKYKVYVLKSDSTTLYSSSFPLYTTGTTYSFTPGTSGDHIYWKVSAVDAAGNEGVASILRHFILQ